MKGLAAALGGIAVTATLAIGLPSTAYGATGQFKYGDPSGHPQSISNPTISSANYVGCSATQQSQIAAAADGAQKYAAGADAYLAGHGSATQRFTTWFGAFTTSRYTTVRAHFRSISQTNFVALTYDCTCQQPEFGHVDPGQADHVVLCQHFWGAPTTGTDSKAGTLVNLVGRFPRNGGLKDSVQGQAECKTLATNNPDAAAMNAASHEYFAENNPPLA
jgi:peptidyl-Lys metalloendopeptidase